jgi:RNA polymerase sigma-70 factor (family 1)
MEATNRTDAVLWQLVKQEDAASFAYLFDRYWEDMFAMAYRRLQEEAAAKDIVQGIFIHTWENRQEIQVQDSLAPYLFTALKYSIVRYVYRAAKKGFTSLPLSILDIPDEENDYQENLQQFDGLQEKIQQEIAAMPGRMREIFTLSREQELSVREIAMRLSLSEQTVKNQLHTALKRLRLRLQDQAFLLPFIL